MDMFLREHATILWVVEGEKYLCVHPPGIVYFYDDDPRGFGNQHAEDHPSAPSVDFVQCHENARIAHTRIRDCSETLAL